MSTLIRISVNGCARCGGGHSDLAMRPLTQPFAPPEAGGLAWTHWAPCPSNGEPILMMVVEPKHEQPAADGSVFRS